MEFVPADITNPETMQTLFDDIDIVFHTAAIFSYSAPINILQKVNVTGTENILNQCIKSNVKKMVLWSSIAAYGKADPKFYSMPITELPVDQLNPKHGGNYDVSKRNQETLARKFYEENQFPITFMRPAPLYGPGSYYGMYSLFKYIKYEMLPIVPRNFHQIQLPLAHAYDVARGAIHLADINNYNGEVYNIADDYSLDAVDTLKYIATLTDSKLGIIIPAIPYMLYSIFRIFGMWSIYEAKHLRKKINGKPPMPKLESDLLLYLLGNFYFDNSKIKQTGFEFTYSDKRLGLLETIKWYEKNGWEKQMVIKGV